MGDFLKSNGIIIVIGFLLLLGVVYLSEFIFGDLTNQDNISPILVALPVLIGVAIYLIYKTNSK